MSSQVSDSEIKSKNILFIPKTLKTFGSFFDNCKKIILWANSSLAVTPGNHLTSRFPEPQEGPDQPEPAVPILVPHGRDPAAVFMRACVRDMQHFEKKHSATVGFQRKKLIKFLDGCWSSISRKWFLDEPNKSLIGVKNYSRTSNRLGKVKTLSTFATIVKEIQQWNWVILTACFWVSFCKIQLWQLKRVRP